MNRTLAHIIKHLFIATALVAFLFQLLNLAVNTHFHILEAGQIVKHSHTESPFSDSDGNHNHSSAEYSTLDIQSFSQTIYKPELGSLSLTTHSSETFEFPSQLNTQEHITYAGRGPPYLSIPSERCSSMKLS